eukprot:g2369.t1
MSCFFFAAMLLIGNSSIEATGTKQAKKALMKAINEGNAQTTAKILQEYPALKDTRDAYSVSILHVAAGSGDKDLLQAIIEGGADLDISIDMRGGHREGDTPLHFAIVEKRSEIVRMLVGAGASISVENKGGLAPLHMAAGVGAVEAMRILLDAGASLYEQASNRYKSLPIHLAAASTNPGAIRELASRGSPVNVPNAYGMYPIHAAAMAGSVESVSVLVEYGVDPTLRNREGRTALELAEDRVAAGDDEVAEALDGLRRVLSVVVSREL